MEEAIKLYNRYRMSGEHELLLDLCTDDFTIVSERDGTYTGKEQVREYLNKVKPPATFALGEPRKMSETRCGVQGTVCILFVDINVVSYYDFDMSGKKIRRIQVNRGTLP